MRMFSLVAGAAFTLASFAVAHAEPRIDVGHTTVRASEGGSINEDDSPAPMLTRELARIWVDDDPAAFAVPQIDSKKIFLHRCGAANPCTVARAGSTNSTLVPDRSNIIGVTQGTLSAFSRGDTVWNNVVQCMRQTFGPFDVEITDVDPGSAAHYEIMIGGTAPELGMPASFGGVSPGTCGSIPSSLVFVFDVWQSNVNAICSTAAQEIAHSWALDHETEPSDPMTYFSYTGQRFFKNAAVTCGSDCVNGVAPGGLACTGQTHQCQCGGNTQNSFAHITDLFGAGALSPPEVTILNPKNNATVQQGFPIGIEATDGEGISKVELKIDGVVKGELAVGPFAFNAPTDLASGNHTITVTASDIYGTPGETTITVAIGKPCGDSDDCDKDSDVCVGGRCVAGPSVAGGLGTECTESAQCVSGTCASTSNGSVCTEHCQAGEDQCPGDFGCVDLGTGDGAGVCIAGAGGGGCSTGGGPVGFVFFGSVAFLLIRRKRS
ncbi:MAG: Ig-like domain-containing protein [Kofleriaceae bacterium]